MSAPEPADMRERILAEATRLFVRLGYDGISMREIAEACGLSKAGLYYHFKGKEGLFLALLYLHLDWLDGVVKSAYEGGGSTRARLLRFTTALLAHLPAEMRSATRLASQELVKLSTQARTDFTSRYQSTFILPIGEFFREGIERGELRPMDVSNLTWAFLGLLYPFINTQATYTPESAGGLAETLIGILFDGVTAHA